MQQWKLQICNIAQPSTSIDEPVPHSLTVTNLVLGFTSKKCTGQLFEDIHSIPIIPEKDPTLDGYGNKNMKISRFSRIFYERGRYGEMFCQTALRQHSMPVNTQCQVTLNVR